MNFLNVLSALFVLYPLFFFRDMARWQQLAFLVGAALWLFNLLFLGVGVLAVVAFFILVIAGFEVVIKYFPLR